MLRALPYVLVALMSVLGSTQFARSQPGGDPVAYMRSYVRSKNLAVGLTSYPYNLYLTQVKLTEVNRLQNTRMALNALQTRAGDRFVAYLGQAYLAGNPACNGDGSAFNASNTDAIIETGCSA